MNRLFSIDSPIYQWLTKASTILWMSVLWLITCLPILTIGASTAAFSRMLFNIHEDRSATFHLFFQAFASNFKQATLLWLLQLAGAIVLALFYWVVLVVTADALRTILLVLFLTALFLWTVVLIYGAPLLSYFENTLWGTLKNTLAMGIRHFRQTVFSLALAMLPVLCTLIFPNFFLRFFPAWLFLSISTVSYAITALLGVVFRNYVTE